MPDKKFKWSKNGSNSSIFKGVKNNTCGGLFDERRRWGERDGGGVNLLLLNICVC